MNSPDSTDLGSRWQLICRSSQSLANTMAANCRRAAQALIAREIRSFCDREPPATEAELDRRERQATFLTSKIGSISHADLMARNHPNVSADILAETKAFLERLGPNDSPNKESLALITTISDLCSSDLIEQR